jgi:hypothetical protein
MALIKPEQLRSGFYDITGSLFGTSSYADFALTASYVMNNNTDTFRITTGSISASVDVGSTIFLIKSASRDILSISNTGIVTITGSLNVTGSVSITQNLAVTQNITGSRMFLSPSNGTVSGSTLTVYGSGSAQPIFTVQGSQGELFSITDSLSGSLFSVNDISGLPILEVFSDNTILMGDYLAPSLNTTTKVTTVIGSNIIYSIPTSSYDGAWFEYTARSGSNARAGQIMSIWNGSVVNFTETTTTEFGDTSGLAFTVMVTGSNLALTGSSTTAGWTIKTIVRSI